VTPFEQVIGAIMSKSLASKFGAMKWEDEVIALRSVRTSAIYFENASCISYANGTVEITLTAIAPNESGGVQKVSAVVAHLRGSVLAAGALRDSIEKAILPAKAVKNSESPTDHWVSDLGEL
jgi:hypothetical protein